MHIHCKHTLRFAKKKKKSTFQAIKEVFLNGLHQDEGGKSLSFYSLLPFHILHREFSTFLCNHGVFAPYYFVVDLKWPLQKLRQKESQYSTLLHIFSIRLFSDFSVFLWCAVVLLQCI